MCSYAPAATPQHHKPGTKTSSRRHKTNRHWARHVPLALPAQHQSKLHLHTVHAPCIQTQPPSHTPISILANLTLPHLCGVDG